MSSVDWRMSCHMTAKINFLFLSIEAASVEGRETSAYIESRQRLIPERKGNIFDISQPKESVQVVFTHVTNAYQQCPSRQC